MKHSCLNFFYEIVDYISIKVKKNWNFFLFIYAHKKKKRKTKNHRLYQKHMNIMPFTLTMDFRSWAQINIKYERKIVNVCNYIDLRYCYGLSFNASFSKF